MRAFLGILVGIVVGIAAQSALDLLASQFYPFVVRDIWDRSEMAAAMAARPTNALLLSVAGYFLGGLLGGVSGKLIWRRPATAWTPALVLAVLALIVAFGYPVPTWSMFASFVAPLLGGLIANHLVGTVSVAANPAELSETAPPEA